jgi:hypothetical protein
MIDRKRSFLNGTARKGADPDESVVNGRSWDIPNLWICDGSVFPTVGGANPSLTSQAIACRTAYRIKIIASRGELEVRHSARSGMQGIGQENRTLVGTARRSARLVDPDWSLVSTAMLKE